MYKLSLHVVPGGERVPLLRDERGLPAFFPTLYSTVRLRNAGAAANTIKNKLSDISVLMRWERLNGRDLAAEFAQRKFLELTDVISLRDFARRDMRAVSEEGAEKTVQRRTLLEARIAPVRALPIVGALQHYNRLTTFADYLEFVATVVTQHGNRREDAEAIAAMTARLRQHRPRGVGAWSRRGKGEKSPPSGDLDRFMAVAAVDHPLNPFRDAAVRMRNAVMFGLLRHTGMRRSELLSLRVDSFDLGHEPLVHIWRTHDDAFDPRPNQPVAKTLERPMPLPYELAVQIQAYILEVRAHVRPARKHPYLFVTLKPGPSFGRPLSISAFSSQVMAAMRSVDPSFASIHPHAFRHHFNYLISVYITDHNAKVRALGRDSGMSLITEAQERDIRAYANGHANVHSGDVYNLRHVREVADLAVRSIQAALAAPSRSVAEKP